MNIAEKVLQLKQDFDEVYEAGKNAGGSSVGEDKIIEKTVSGKSVAILDISEIPHNIIVGLTSDSISNFSNVKVTKYGRNIYDAQKYPLTNNRYVSPTDGSVSYMSGGYAATEDLIPCKHLRGLVITIPHTSSNSYGLAFFDDNQKLLMYIKNEFRSQITTLVPERASYFRFTMSNVYMEVAQVVIGIDVPDYAPYREQIITPSAGGTITIDHTAPYLFLTTDNDNVNIKAIYNASWGRQEEYEARWNSIQDNGERLNYTYAFAGAGWNDGVYDPRYPIKIQNAGADVYSTSYITDTKVPIIWSLANSIAPFRNCYYLITIRELFLATDISVASNCFTNCQYLENIKFSGTGKIKTDIDLHYSPLTKESITSVVNALSTTTTDKTITLSAKVVNMAFDMDIDDEMTYSSDWIELRESKRNWNFNYTA